MRVYGARIAPSPACRARGVRRAIDAYAVIYGWRGRDIDRALGSYLQDLYSCAPRAIQLPGGTELKAGGQAHLVARRGSATTA